MTVRELAKILSNFPESHQDRVVFCGIGLEDPVSPLRLITSFEPIIGRKIIVLDAAPAQVTVPGDDPKYG